MANLTVDTVIDTFMQATTKPGMRAAMDTWALKTTTYNPAVAGDRIQADTTTSGAFTITLPASPTVGDTILIEDANGSWGTNALTLGRNSLKINGATSDYTANVANGKLSCVYISAGWGWSIK